MRQPRAVTDKRYEEKHKEERKAKSLVWGTSVPRQFAEEINEFLSQYGFTKVLLLKGEFPIWEHRIFFRECSIALIVARKCIFAVVQR